MTNESRAAFERLAVDTKRASATSADITKAASNPGAKNFAFHAKAISCHAKAVIGIHSLYFTAAGGVIVGIVAYHLVNKYWLNKKDTTA